MNDEIKSILNKIESKGYEAYIVGGFVRDTLLNIDSYDVDIITNALPKEVLKIFNIKKETLSYEAINLKKGKYTFDISTYRVESNYYKRKPQNIEYTNNLLLDLQRRDFTINSICMNKDGKIFDYLNGKLDITKKQIKVIGDVYQKLTDDPLRMLRAIRFASILRFSLHSDIEKFILENKKLIENLSFQRKKEELDKIFSSRNAEYGIELLKKLNLLDILEINYDRIVVVPDLNGIWAQINYSDKYPITKNNKLIIGNIREIINKGLTKQVLYEYDLYTLTVAGQILGYSAKKINDLYKNNPIHNITELNISAKEIIEILRLTDLSCISIIQKDLIDMILNKKILNDNFAIKNYIIEKWK